MAKNEKEANKKQKSHFFRDMKAELKKVIWPSAKQTANNTLAVIGFTLVLAAIVFVLDLAFDFANKNGVVALQEKIKTSYSAKNTTADNTTAENATTEANTVDNATNVQAEVTTEETQVESTTEITSTDANSTNTQSN